MNKRNLILILSIFILSSCSSGESNNSKFNASNKKNYNDIQSALKNDPNNAGTDTNQNPDDYKIERHKGAVANEDEYNKPETKDEITKEELDKKRDEDAKDGIINISEAAKFAARLVFRAPVFIFSPVLVSCLTNAPY